MLKGSAVDCPPPGASVETETLAQPNCCTREASTVAVSWPLLRTVVGSDCPFQRTVEAEVKASPLTVRTKVSEPAWIKAGESCVTTGGGLKRLPLIVVFAEDWLLVVTG